MGAPVAGQVCALLRSHAARLLALWRHQMSGSGEGRERERERAIGDKRAFKGDHCSRFDGWINYGVMA